MPEKKEASPAAIADKERLAWEELSQSMDEHVVNVDSKDLSVQQASVKKLSSALSKATTLFKQRMAAEL
jgi:hypothetical protein